VVADGQQALARSGVRDPVGRLDARLAWADRSRRYGVVAAAAAVVADVVGAAARVLAAGADVLEELLVVGAVTVVVLELPPHAANAMLRSTVVIPTLLRVEFISISRAREFSPRCPPSPSGVLAPTEMPWPVRIRQCRGSNLRERDRTTVLAWARQPERQTGHSLSAKPSGWWKLRARPILPGLLLAAPPTVESGSASQRARTMNAPGFLRRVRVGRAPARFRELPAQER
jgi:hypothetical protein